MKHENNWTTDAFDQCLTWKDGYNLKFSQWKEGWGSSYYLDNSTNSWEPWHDYCKFILY